MKKRLLSLLIVTALFAQAKDKRPEITTEKLISKSSTPVTVIPRIRPGYNPRPMLDVRETVDEWCGTMPAWIEKYGTPRACTYFGATDDPTVRDSFIPTAATDTLIIRLYVHAFADDSGNNPTAELSDAEAQLLTLNEAYSDYTIKFDMTFQIHNDAQYQEISSAEWSSGEIKEAYAADPLQYHNLYVTNSSSDWGILGVSTFPWDSEALTKYGGTIVDKDWFGGPRTFWGTPNISQHTITHELGHALGLWHTHHGVYEVTTCGDCYEGADGYTYDVGDSADVVGDLCSDTKATTKNFSCADPDTFDCQNNDFIDTDFHNFMGYADDDCYDLDNDGFSTQQSGRMHGWITDKYLGLIADSVNKTLLSTSFEDGMPNDWSVIDNDGDGNVWYASYNPYYGDVGVIVRWNSGGNDDWLITPEIQIPSTFSSASFSFWARSIPYGTTREDFNVMLATAGTAVSNFTTTLGAVTDASDSWTQYSYDLSSYAGQSIYLAVQCVSINQYYLNVDDFLVSGDRITNYAPVASDTSFTTDEDVAVGITLSATDADGDSLTYAVVDSPAYGTISGSGSGSSYSLSFDGVDDYVRISDNTNLESLTDGNFSFSVWASPIGTPNTDGQIVARPGWHMGIVYSLNKHFIAEIWDENNDQYTVSTLETYEDSWHHLVMTYDSITRSMHLYVDGDSIGTVIMEADIRNYNTDYFLGMANTTPSSQWSYPFSGRIDDLAFYDIVLSGEEIAALYNSGFGLDASTNSGNYTSSANIQGYWRFDQNSGTTLYDLSENGNNGNIYGATWSNDSPVASLIYTPNANYNGTDSFTFTASDGEATSNTATVSLTVNAVNDAPVASDTSLTTDEDTDLTGTLPGSDVDGDALTFAITDSSVNGTVILDDASSGSFTYSPTANFSGSDSVSFSVSDGTAADTGKVSITVNAVNDAPTFTSTAVTSVDEDSEYSYTISTSDAEGDSVFVTAPTIPDWLTLSVNSSHWVSTYAGSADVGGLVDSTLLESRFSYPRGICVTDDGTIYVGDDGNSVLRKISTDGIVSTLAGSGTATYQDGQGTAASFNNLYGMDLDSAGNIYVADYYGRRIRKVTPDGLVTTYAGNGGWGNVDGPAENAEFYQPYDVAVDNQGNVYVSCTHAYTIRKITPDGMVSTIAGIPSQRGLVDGDSTTALLHSPNSIEVDDSGNVYFGDYATLRKITPDGNIVTIAGTGTQGHADGQGTNAQIYRLDGLTYDNSTNILYGTNYWYECIRAIDQDGNVTTIAGNNSTGAMDGDGSVAQFNSPQDLYLWGTSLYISDTANDIIRKVDLPASTLSGTPDNDDVGDHSVSLLATDENGATATQDFTITVNNVNDTPTAFSLLTPADSSLLILDETNAMSDSLMFSWETSMDPDDSVMYAFHAHHTIYSDGDSAGYLDHDTLMSGTMLYVLYEDILGDITDFMGDSSEIRWDVAAIGGMDTVLSQNGHLHFNVDAHEAVDYVAPVTPIYLFATPGNTHVKLIWKTNSESDLSSYNVYGGTSASPTALLTTITAGTTTYADVDGYNMEAYTVTGLTNDTTYYYCISAVDSSGNESDKTVDLIVTPDNPTATAPSGSGTSADPYQIASLENLNWISQNPDSFDDYFIQTADIDASSASDWYGGAGFYPIGAVSPYFSGTYDGDNYLITDLSINKPVGVYIGLFGVVQDNGFGGADIKNIGLVNVNVTAVIDYDPRVGGLFGYIYNSSIDNCYVTGNISSTEDGHTGLLAATNYLGTVTNSYSSGTILAQDGKGVGGLIGSNRKGTIQNCFSTGSVIANNKVGGLVGSSYGDGTTFPLIENSYSRCDVTASTYENVGGFIGANGWNGGTINNCYSMGTVIFGNSGNWDQAGGFAGCNTPTENTFINASFWDIDSSGQSTGIGYGSGDLTGKTTSEMKTLSTFTDAGWDFVGESANGNDEIWEIDANRNDGYPYLPSTFNMPYDFALLSPDDSLMISLTNENLMSDSVVFVWESTSDPDGDTVMYRAKFGHVVYSGSAAIDTVRHDSTLADTSIVVFYEDIYDDINDLGGDNSVIKWNVAAIAGMDTVLSENGPRFVLADATSLNVDEEFIPTEFALHQNYPNPFNPVTTIQYDIPEAGEIRLDVYNILGEKVATLVQGNHHVGRYTIRWDAAGMASGMYFYRISSAKFTATKKLVLMK